MNSQQWFNELRARLGEVIGDSPTREVARLTGHPADRIRRYLTNARPSPEFLAAVCNVYGINANWLLLGIGPKHGTRLSAIARDLIDWRRVVAAAGGAIEEEAIFAADQLDASDLPALRDSADGRSCDDGWTSNGHRAGE